MRLRLLVVPLALAAAAAFAAPAQAADLHGHHEVFPDADARSGAVAPTAAQRAAVAALGAEAEWNRFGTPHTLVKHGGFLAEGVAGADADAAARAWLAANGELFRLGSAAALETLAVRPLGEGGAHAVVLRQRFGALEAAQDGVVTVGLTGSQAAGWKVAYASSTLSGATGLAGGAALTAAQAWLAAANDVGLARTVAHIAATKEAGGWTTLSVPSLGELQRARLRALPLPGAPAVPVWETIVLRGGPAPIAYKHHVDARSGAILVRENLVHQLEAPEAETFAGDLGPQDGACGELHGPYTAPSGTRSIDVVATADLPLNDIVLHLKRGGQTVASFDSGTSPEAIHYEPATGVPAGDYHVQVCEYADGAGALPPSTYTGTIALQGAAGTTPVAFPPRWEVFPASPPLPALTSYPWNASSADTRETWCWAASVGGNPVEGCDREVQNLAARVPWDFDPRTGTPTFTTLGNAASAAEAWGSPLTPGPTGHRPVSLDRRYVYPWANDWYARSCAPDNFVPGAGYDISAAVTNLFAMHNRMHDWSYHLGFTEDAWNMQRSNFGNAGAENDPVIGNAQAGAASGGFPSYLGRDNANMITLPDGVSPITNMYLWQPLASAFYAPCVDGDYDMAVIGHEYGHAIENRMIGKGGNRSGHHAGAMGESSGDLLAVEYLNEYGFVPVDGENPFSVGAYATGNKERGIRNYAMNRPQAGGFPAPGVVPATNPLAFGAMGYDLTGPQVHADGEIWSATNHDIRAALVAKYDAAFPSGDRALQLECAEGRRQADQCPGNRRWIQLMFDAYLLMPVAPSMLQARDAYLAADLLRFGGANQSELWLAFARRGMGAGAASSNALTEGDADPLPDHASPRHGSAAVTFRAVDETGAPVRARIYVGHFEARVSPVADTDPATTGQNLDDTAEFAPGTYELVANAPGYGHLRVSETFRAGKKATVTLRFQTNWASAAKGATAAGDGVRHGHLIDDTEGTNWERTGAVPDVAGSQVTVRLGGTGARTVGRVQVSAMLLPGQNRFTALRQFELWTCVESLANAGCTLPTGWTKRLTSEADAFPGSPPRPVSPALLLRSWTLPSAVQATHVRIVVATNQCTGAAAFQGEQDADPLNGTDCRLGSPGAGPVTLIGDLPQVLAPQRDAVRIAELQVFAR
jgi:extracellular elastinolytic metalloproteinase